MVLEDDDVSVEASLSENFHRVAMNPADECTAFKYFIDKGTSAEDVAKRFGVTTRFVEQRVRLAELAPVVFASLAAGEITLGAAQAYAVTNDVDRQTRVFENMVSAYYGNNPDNIRRAILNGSVKPSDAKARFVGVDAYLAGGGRIERDLFGSDDDASWTDSDMLETLAAAKLEAAAAALATDQGLAFVIPVLATHVPYDVERQYHEFHAAARPLTAEETARIIELSDENDALIEQLDTDLNADTPEGEAAEDRISGIEGELQRIDEARRMIDSDSRAQLGTFVFIGFDGDLRVHARLFSERPIKSPTTGSESKVDDTETPDTSAKLSVTLMDELATRRCQILAAHIASDPALSLDLTIFLMADRIVYSTGHIVYNITINAREAQMPIMAFRDEGSPASTAIEEQRQALDTSWAGYPTLSERFDAFRALDEQARGAWLAFATAKSIEATLNTADGYRSNGFHDHLGRVLGIDVAQWWRPNAENFFGRVKKEVMLDALDEIGGPVLRCRYKDAKKSELATTCASLCNGGGIIEAEIREKAVAWLPDSMRFGGKEKPQKTLIHHSFRTEEPEDGDLENDGDDQAGVKIDSVADTGNDGDHQQAA